MGKMRGYGKILWWTLKDDTEGYTEYTIICTAETAYLSYLVADNTKNWNDHVHEIMEDGEGGRPACIKRRRTIT